MAEVLVQALENRAGGLVEAADHAGDRCLAEPLAGRGLLCSRVRLCDTHHCHIVHEEMGSERCSEQPRITQLQGVYFRALPGHRPSGLQPGYCLWTWVRAKFLARSSHWAPPMGVDLAVPGGSCRRSVNAAGMNEWLASSDFSSSYQKSDARTHLCLPIFLFPRHSAEAAVGWVANCRSPQST